MRIGIHAKWFFTGPVSTRTILQNLLPQLFSLYPEHEWIIFMDRKDRNKTFPLKKENVTIKYLWADNNLLSNIFILPGLVRKNKVDLMVYQTFPFPGKTPSIAFIHDILFERFPQFFTWREKLYFLPLKTLTRKATRLMATSNFVADELITYGYTRHRNKIDLVPLAVSGEFKPLSQHPANMVEGLRKKYQLPGDQGHYSKSRLASI